MDEHEPSAHYDRVTRAWGMLLGEELHYGLFAVGDEPLPVATAALTTSMMNAAELTTGMRLLDVGCGTGGPARRLAREAGVEVLGITTSTVGVREAIALSADVPAVSFEARDGLDNGLPDATFDRAWALESSHLMPERRQLVEECARVLVPGGRFVLCDIVRRREIPFVELREKSDMFAVLRQAFGAARMDTLDDYRELFEQSGLDVDDVADLTLQTRPTFDRWRDNLERHRSEVERVLDTEDVAAFEQSLSILAGFWDDGTLGYGLISGQKPA